MSSGRLSQSAPKLNRRENGYAAIRDYAVIGDGRTAALVAADGSIDWLGLPDLDSGSVFGAMLDAENGGAFRLAPTDPFTVQRRYVDDTNLLETSFETARGAVRITDAMPLPLSGLAPTRELVRRIDGLSGEVAMRWSIEPRFGYAQSQTRIGRRAGVAVADAGSDAIAVLSFEAGEPQGSAMAIEGRFTARPGSRSLLALSAAHGDPLVFSPRSAIEQRMERTVDYWRRWSEQRSYEGPWRGAVIRSSLALKLLINAPSGAIAAAATTSLPEELGGVRHWDYRSCWIRDSSATLDALLSLGCPSEGEAFFWWLLHASQLTSPEVNVLYRLNGRAKVPESELGNAAAPQRQLDVYGHLFQTAWLFVEAGGVLSADISSRLASTADLISSIWSEEDSGIWEVRGLLRHFTESKMMCWIALDRACRLAAGGHIADKNAGQWRAQATAIRRFVSEQCWSSERRSYMRFPDASETDASILLPVLMGYGADERQRLVATVRNIRAELGSGALLHRYRGEDGLPGQEGAFLACSFWLVDALARLGEIGQASELMEELLAHSNDVGLYAEEIDPTSGAFLGNFPQGLVHLALINAAVTLQERSR